jgi:transcriptional regulator with XRE-family HTH domain
MSKKKQTYKVLTQWQETGAISRAQKGWSQERIAKSLGVAKIRVSRVLKAKKVGKRRVSPFWKSVTDVQEATGYTWKEARETVYHAPKWGKKRAARAGKKYKRYEDFWKWVREEELSEREVQEKMEEEMEEYYFDTPK